MRGVDVEADLLRFEDEDDLTLFDALADILLPFDNLAFGHGQTDLRHDDCGTHGFPASRSRFLLFIGSTPAPDDPARPGDSYVMTLSTARTMSDSIDR